MVQTDKVVGAEERGIHIDDSVQLPDDFAESEIFQEYLRRSKLSGDELPSAADSRGDA